MNYLHSTDTLFAVFLLLGILAFGKYLVRG